MLYERDIVLLVIVAATSHKSPNQKILLSRQQKRFCNTKDAGKSIKSFWHPAVARYQPNEHQAIN
jgi:hypothetical protein